MSGAISYLGAVVVFSSLIFLSIFIFELVFQAPNLEGLFLNLCTIPFLKLIYFLLAIIIITVFISFLLRVNRKTLLIIFSFLIGVSSCFVMCKGLYDKYQIKKFFGDSKAGSIIFISECDTSGEVVKKAIIFSLSDQSFKNFSSDEFNQNYEKNYLNAPMLSTSPSPDKRYFAKPDPKSDKFLVVAARTNRPIFKLKHWLLSPAEVTWSPDSKFIVYDYSYDQDDLNKIFVAEVETGKTILLAAGANPIWIK